MSKPNKADRSKSTSSITIPYNYTPRSYQVPFWRAMATGTTRAVKVWHRRSGKDKTDLNFTISKMFPENGGRIGTYFHLFPTYAQAKKVIWDGIDKSGFKVLDHFPPPLVANKNESELQITLVNGSIFQLIGTDKIDSVVGTNPVGCVFSEFSLQNPKAWDLISPILLENKGWATFNFTPRGHNHAEGLYEMAKATPSWYCTKFTVDDTFDENGEPVISKADIEAERQRLLRQGRSESDVESFLQQEYYCSFEGYQEGSYYTKQLAQAQKDGRIGRVPWISNLPVFTFWDLGVGDACAIWFAQRVGLLWHFIDYEENSGEAVGFYAKLLKEKPYTYQRHYWPHDGKNRDFGGTGETRRATGEQLGIRPLDIVPRGDIDDGIEAVRGMLPESWFDETKCQKGLNALKSYHKAWDEDRKEFQQKPYHDWSSNGADALRTCAKSDAKTLTLNPAPLSTMSGFDPRQIQRAPITTNNSFDPRLNPRRVG